MKRKRLYALSRPLTPFGILVGHFVKRMLASEEDQGTGSVSLGLGAVLAILASPGGFASIFLMDKYSSLMHFLRGQTNFNPYRASIGDEYFFVVLSMTITGLVMVLRWNRLLPDYRDFANLAVLPIPIRDVFLANFIALAGLAVVFGIDVNAASSFLFPEVVTASDRQWGMLFRLAPAHAAAVFSASMFSFFAVFALVGVLMLIVPRRIFRPVSIGVRILLVVGLLSEFLSNLFLQLFSGRVPHLREIYMQWLPSYWFLGVYAHVAGLANGTTDALAREGMTGLCAAIVIAVVAYALCYRRHFLRLAESLQLVGFTRHSLRLPMAEWVERILFRSEFEHACSGFISKVLLRSERHLMFLGAYLGIGAVLAAQMAADSMSRRGGNGLPHSESLAVPVVVALILVTGLRFAFDIPAGLEANWVFRIGTESPTPAPAEVARRFLLWATLPWEIAIVGPLAAHEFGWAVACEEVTALAVATMLLIEIVLIGYRKIPFTCTTGFDSRRLLVRILGPVFGVLIIAPGLGGFERWMMQHPARFGAPGVIAAGIWFLLWRQNRKRLPYENSVQFEERSAVAFELLKLN